MKKQRFVILSLILLCAGCLPATKAEIQDLTNSISQIVPVVREAVSTESEDTKDKVEAVLAKVEQVNEKVATAEDPIDAADKGWKATEPFNPYYGYGAFVIMLLKAWRDKKEKDGLVENINTLDAKYSAAKVGMDTFKIRNPDRAAELYKDIGDARLANKIV